MTNVDYGKLEILHQKDLTVIERIQRTPSDARIRYLRENWDDSKVGILLVSLITDTEYRGKKHVSDGGSRWRSKANDPNYLFACYTKEETLQEAAQRFLNAQEGMKPNAFARFRVGTAAGEPSALAVEKALSELGISPGDVFGAFAAAERIVKTGYGEFLNGGGEDEAWEAASEHLAWTLGIGERVYPDSPDAYNADIIQGISVIGMMHPRFKTDDEDTHKLVKATNSYYEGDSKLDRMFDNLDTMRPAHWLTAYVAKKGNMGGSSSRGAGIGRLIVQNYNRANNSTLRLP